MKYTDDYEDEKKVNKVMISMGFIMALVMLVIFGFVIASNKKGHSNGQGYQRALARAGLLEEKKDEDDSIEKLISGSKLTSDELDIWTLPGITKEERKEADHKNGVVKNQTTGENMDVDTQIFSTTKIESGKEIVASNENEIGAANESVQAFFDKDNLIKDNNRLYYIKDDKTLSKTGVIITRKQGEINFKRLNNANIDFCMIKVGQRGFASGNIVLEPDYKKLIEEAVGSGFPVGVFFTTQAIDKNEINEEADELLAAIDDLAIDYPLCICVEKIKDELARTDILDTDFRTDLLIFFLERIKDAGYMPMIYGDYTDLTQMLDLERIKEYPVWYNYEQEEPLQDVEFAMWQYQSLTTVNGIEEKTGLILALPEQFIK